MRQEDSKLKLSPILYKERRPPTGSRLTVVFRDLIDRWHKLNPPLDWRMACQQINPSFTGIDGQIEHLALINCFQWDLEDACRESYPEPERVVYLKRSIDKSNRHRIHVINEINYACFDLLFPFCKNLGQTRLPTESLGSIYDRLSILEIKRFHVGLELKTYTAQYDLCEKSESPLQLLEEEIIDLSQALNNLISDFIEGRLRLKVYHNFKVYKNWQRKMGTSRDD